MKTLITLLLLSIAGAAGAQAQQHRFDPPWNTPPASEVMFTIPGVDNVPDLVGDINDPQLVVFFAGNQFMCVDDLLAAFKKAYPRYQRVFAETLPPGILAKQIQGGTLTVGNMRVTVKPDVYTAGKARIDRMTSILEDTAAYAYNKLAILVQKGNPKQIKGLADLGREDVRVSMPNPQWEGIARQIERAYLQAGGTALRDQIMKTKVQDHSTFLTHIHHRQTPMRILYDQSDAGPVWYSEAYFQRMIHHPVELIPIADSQNVTATYMAGVLKNAPHQQAARDFMQFLTGSTAKAIYRKYGFTTP